jgi:hypothetical protein
LSLWWQDDYGNRFFVEENRIVEKTIYNYGFFDYLPA